MWNNIIKSLAGDYIYCDLETSALDINKGIIIGEAYVPFNISYNKETFEPRVHVPFGTITEHWPVACLHTGGYWADPETMKWHMEKNEAWQHYEDFFNAQDIYKNGQKINHIEDLFRNGHKFISRHSFDSKWLESHRPIMFKCIHYRNFLDMATLIPALGFGDKEEYKYAFKRAEQVASEFQRDYAQYTDIESDALCIPHRALSDCLFDIFMIKEMLETYYVRTKDLS